MLLRLIPELGGDGTVCGIIAMNDTGSDVLSLFTTDLPYLRGNIQGYHTLSKNNGSSQAGTGRQQSMEQLDHLAISANRGVMIWLGNTRSEKCAPNSPRPSSTWHTSWF